MAEPKITREMLAAARREMKDVDAAIQIAAVHGFELPYVEEQNSPVARAYRAMRKLEPTTT